jgi:DnaK suppressor protein
LPPGKSCRAGTPPKEFHFNGLTFSRALLAGADQAAISPRVPYPKWAGRPAFGLQTGQVSCGRITRKNKRMMVSLPPDYRPTEDEAFMNPVQAEYFRQKLLRWRSDLLREADGTLASLSQGGIHEADITDRASVETDRALELRTRDRARKLISKIDQALVRIEVGTYGYCEETDEPIGIRRLEARPIATMSIEAQEKHERMERVHRDD